MKIKHDEFIQFYKCVCVINDNSEKKPTRSNSSKQSKHRKFSIYKATAGQNLVFLPIEFDSISIDILFNFISRLEKKKINLKIACYFHYFSTFSYTLFSLWCWRKAAFNGILKNEEWRKGRCGFLSFVFSFVRVYIYFLNSLKMKNIKYNHNIHTPEILEDLCRF